MLRDVFYYGKKPNVHPREKPAVDLDDARRQATTEHFWIVNEFCNYYNFDWDFDFDFLPDEEVWHSECNNAWPSQHQKDSGTWLCPKEYTDKIIYRTDVDAIKRGADMSKWVMLDKIDTDHFDFSWHPDPTSPPYIYKWGTKFFRAEVKHVLEYHTPGATQEQFIPFAVPLEPEWEKLEEMQKIDRTKFDLSFRPDPLDPPYIYVWGNKWIPAELKPTLVYHATGATERKYMKQLLEVLPDWDCWVEHIPVNKSKFDFTWRPDPREPAYNYVWGNKYESAEEKPTLEYRMPGATETKYMSKTIEVVPQWDRWNILDDTIDKDKFDFSWRPDPREPAFIYTWGNKWVDAEMQPTLEYYMPGATERRYMGNDVDMLPQWDRWVEHTPVDKNKSAKNNFDFSWRPDPREPAYNYVWGNKYEPAEIVPTLEYRMPGATEIKYMPESIEVLPQWKRWIEHIHVDKKRSEENGFDFSWRPDPREPAYNYVWGNKFEDAEIKPTLEYRMADATQIKYMTERVDVLPEWDRWVIIEEVDKSTFDFSWRPDPREPAYIYVFGNQWHSAEKQSTVEYHVLGATQIKYVHDIIAEVLPTRTNWEVSELMDTDIFDFSWRPDPGAPPYIYQFGTLEDDNDGPRYITPKNDGEVVRLLRVNRKDKSIDYRVARYYIETTLEHLINEHKNEIFWALNKNINYSDFDFSWRPSIEQARYVHVFGSPESEMTHTYFVSGKMYQQGYKDFNFVQDNITLDEKYLVTLFKPSDVFYIDRGNIESAERFEKLKEQFPDITKTRYLNSWVDTIARCTKRSTTELCWILNSELDYTDFDFNYYPNPWQMNLVHVFGTQWSHWGTTFMVNKETFLENTKYIKIIEHLGNLHFVKKIKAKATNNLYDIYLIDHGNEQTENIKQLLEGKSSGKTVKVIPYTSDYLTTFNFIIADCQPLKEHYIWVCSSVCDYTLFDFSYICDPFAKDNLHVFPSEGQRYGDTFLVDVNKMRLLLKDMVLLEDYQKINFNTHQCLPRLSAPVFVTEQDSHRTVTEVEYGFPYAIFKTYDNEDLTVAYRDPMSLWSDSTKNIEILSTGGTIIAVPNEAKNYVQSELYDYPFISRAKKLIQSKPLDIVFLSNGEKCADENYEHLLRVTKNYENKVIRVDGVDGRAQAYHAAAKASETPWLFTVFAKLKVNNRFDWSWQPDRLQVPKHYIFNALNPMNKLVYGHQAMIAYNKKLVLNNTGRGLDFTLDDEHEVIDMLSGVAIFNTDSFSTWRTAFREVIKLKSDYKDISYDRLNTWLTIAEGEYAEDCLRGAKDGVEYYNQVNGDIEKLKLSYEWSWLKEYYNRKYK